LAEFTQKSMVIKQVYLIILDDVLCHHERLKYKSLRGIKKRRVVCIRGLMLKGNTLGKYILEMTGISKTFSGVLALKDVSFRLRPGTVHALTGENGAGKSTLMKCLIGLYKPDSGDIMINGEKVHITNPLEATKMGISMIHQELSPIVERSVAENMFIGRMPMKGKVFIDHKEMYSRASEILRRVGVDIDPHTRMGSLTVAKMQMVEIARAVSQDSSIIVMDEPTSSLTTSETNQLLGLIHLLKKKNVAIIYISHKMEEIFEICDEVTVFRDGEMVGTDLIANIDIKRLIHLMVGRELGAMFPKVTCPITDIIMEVEDLASENTFSNVNFQLRCGEILGFAGLVGAGRTEVLETLFGLRRKTFGTVRIKGKEINIHRPSDAMACGIAMLTEDRRGTGIIPTLSIADNIVVANLKQYVTCTGFISHFKIIADAEEYIEKLNIKTPTRDTLIQDLSGGNQQKALVARWLLTRPDILFIDEPTRGIDVGAKAEIHSLITNMARRGKAIIMVSSEMSEILGMCDRILVMHEGVQTVILERVQATQERIMEYATGYSMT
jgi:methyl-galactoside transport system ATP-binding protein/inositol transport system ATP-binding protein